MKINVASRVNRLPFFLLPTCIAALLHELVNDPYTRVIGVYEHGVFLKNDKESTGTGAEPRITQMFDYQIFVSECLLVITNPIDHKNIENSDSRTSVKLKQDNPIVQR